MTIVEATRSVVGGIDTHGEVHVVAALDGIGGLLGSESFGANPAGYEALLTWLESFGTVAKVGVEGTGSYGAGIARHLARAGIVVIEIDRPNRQIRRNAGKSDPSTPSKRPEPPFRGRRARGPRAATVGSRRGASFSSPSARRGPPG